MLSQLPALSLSRWIKHSLQIDATPLPLHDRRRVPASGFIVCESFLDDLPRMGETETRVLRDRHVDSRADSAEPCVIRLTGK